MKRVGQKVYDSATWHKLRLMYLESRNYICERCGQPATICHHRKYLTAANVNTPTVAFDTANLEALCQTCHNIEHQQQGDEIIFNAAGDVVGVKEKIEVQEFKAARAAISRLNFNPPTLSR